MKFKGRKNLEPFVPSWRCSDRVARVVYAFLFSAREMRLSALIRSCSTPVVMTASLPVRHAAAARRPSFILSLGTRLDVRTAGSGENLSSQETKHTENLSLGVEAGGGGVTFHCIFLRWI